MLMTVDTQLLPIIIPNYYPLYVRLFSCIADHYFRSVRKSVKSDFVMSGCPSVRMEQLGSNWTDVRETEYEYFSKICRENARYIKAWQEKEYLK